VNEKDRALAWPVGIADDLPERFWAEGGSTEPVDDDRLGGDPAAGMATMGFIFAALRRRLSLWVSLAIVGFIIGSGVFVAQPPSYPAGTTILLSDSPSQDPQVQINADAALAQSTAVGAAAMSQLGINESVTTFLGSYTVTAVSDQVLLITLAAKTTAAAVQRANAVADAFLKIRASYADTEETQQEQYLGEQISSAKQSLSSVTTQLAQAESSGASTARVNQLKQQQTSDANALSEVQQNVTTMILGDRTGTQAEVEGTRVINPAAPVHKSKVKAALTYVGGGLGGGLFLGIAIVVIGALLSDKLRRRDDVAYALGVPVGLSVGPLRVKRLSPSGRKRAKNRQRDMRRLVQYLRKAVPGKQRDVTSLAVVAVSDPHTVAEAVVALATDAAAKGGRVLLADLSDGCHAGRLLGAQERGVHRIESNGARLVLAIPDPDDVAPIGPLPGKRGLMAGAKPGEEIAAVATTADLILSLVSLDPARGGDHVATWATAAVAVVTAGESSALLVRSSAEMVQLAGTRLRSGVLIGADHTDESLGAWEKED
jgi:capsular polysaccharide biosynthesis protein